MHNTSAIPESAPSPLLSPVGSCCRHPPSLAGIPSREHLCRLILFVVLLPAVLLTHWAAVSRAAARYTGRLRDGRLVEADEITDWSTAEETPRLAGHPLTGTGATVRWVVDTTLPVPDELEAFIEFQGGDRLPGTVHGWHTPEVLPGTRGETHLVVEPSIPLDPPGQAEPAALRINLRWVRRIVWQQIPGNRIRPATAFFRDGRELDFRAIRWATAGLQLLTSEGVRTVSTEELAELHLPRLNPWEAWLDQLAVLASTAESRLMQLETADGLVATCSFERFEASSHGDRKKADNWRHQFQPAWSLDPLWIHHRTVRARRFFLPHEVPLTLIEPDDVERQAAFAAGWRWKRDRSVYGETAVTGGQPTGWSLGVHAWCRMALPLHPSVRSFSARAGLDQAAGEGGCVRLEVAHVRGSQPERRLYRSSILRGSMTSVETGNLRLQPTAREAGQLVLLADSVVKDRPAGADPFDIRDAVNWIEPLLELDPELLAHELNARRFQQVPALTRWTPEVDAPAGGAGGPSAQSSWQTRSWRDALVPGQPEYRLVLIPASPFSAFSRRLRFPADTRYLAVYAGRPERGSPEVTMQVSAAGKVLCEFLLPEFASSTLPAPVLVPVSHLAGKSAKVRVVLIGSDPSAAVDIRAIAPVSSPPGLLRLFEDEPAFLRGWDDEEGQLTLLTLPDERPAPDSPEWRDGTRAVFSGTASLQLKPPSISAPLRTGLAAPIREYPQPGEYRYLRFAWKKQGGGHAGIELARNGVLGSDGDNLPLAGPELAGPGRFPPRRTLKQPRLGLRYGYRYVAGPDSSLWPVSLTLTRTPPGKWQLLERDLYAEFGSMTLTGMALLCPDGESVSFDHIWLARTREDLRKIPEQPGQPPAPPPLPPTASLTTAGPDGTPLVHTDLMAFGRLMAGIAPRFSLSGNVRSGQLLAEFRGRPRVLELHAATNPPPLLRSALVLPKGQPHRLRAVIGNNENTSWLLRVRADGKQLFEQPVTSDTTTEGWLESTVDLARFAGQRVLLEVELIPQKGSQVWLQQLEIISGS